ncbi:hydrogenase expression/formation protein HypE [Aestuariivivens sediminicola]|uniref:hydrogenase expression/formation protein HypE n=1 Tax=Aestuariivivens sediminicola TaxID=2913560 RepID=UPI001F575A53|nr:hydrogenase expression/formation protein HypE [Aestuariivivens sediminicola]
MDIQKLGFDTINLGHGSGGLMTRDLLDNIIFQTFDNPILDKKHDGAIVNFEGRIAISTDSFVVSPVFFKGGNIGELAVHGTVNDVAMCGAIPKYISLAFIIEEGLILSEFITIVKSIKKAADESGVHIITGDTKVVEKGKGDKIFINTTGFGPLHPKANISTMRIREGDSIVLSGSIATHGMAIMSERQGLEFESDIVSDTTNLNYLVRDLLDAFGDQIHFLRDPTRGGLSGVLTEIVQDTGIGISIFEDRIPIEKQVAAACEILGLDPLYVANEGVFIAIVDKAIETSVIQFMQKDVKGPNAVCIGEMTTAASAKVILNSRIGGKRIVSPLIGEQLPRIC